jgi:hypothetical protein
MVRRILRTGVNAGAVSTSRDGYDMVDPASTQPVQLGHDLLHATKRD